MKNNLSFSQALMVLVLVSSAISVEAAPKGVDIEKDSDKSPLGCRDVGYKFDLKVLNLLPEEAGERQSLYFIYNKLAQPVSLYQMRKDESTRMLFLNHVISGRQWAVLSTSEKSLKYICTIEKPKLSHGKIVDCSESIKVCEYARVKYGMNNQGNYWMVGSNTRGGAVNAVLHYGIIPR